MLYERLYYKRIMSRLDYHFNTPEFGLGFETVDDVTTHVVQNKHFLIKFRRNSSSLLIVEWRSSINKTDRARKNILESPTRLLSPMSLNLHMTTL